MSSLENHCRGWVRSMCPKHLAQLWAHTKCLITFGSGSPQFSSEWWFLFTLRCDCSSLWSKFKGGRGRTAEIQQEKQLPWLLTHPTPVPSFSSSLDRIRWTFQQRREWLSKGWTENFGAFWTNKALGQLTRVCVRWCEPTLGCLPALLSAHMLPLGFLQHWSEGSIFLMAPRSWKAQKCHNVPWGQGRPPQSVSHENFNSEPLWKG